MAKSGTITKYFYSNNYDNLAYATTDASSAIYSLKLNWEVTGTDVVNSTSTIGWNIEAKVISFDSVDGQFDFGTPSYLRFGTDDVQTAYPKPPYPDVLVKLGSTTIYSTDSIVVDVHENETKQLASGSFIVTHDSAGAFTDTLSCTVRPKNIYDTTGNPAYAPYDDTDLGSKSAATVSVNVSPDYLPKYAVIQSAPESFTDEDSPTITFVIPNGVTNVRAYISFSTSTVDIGSYAVSGSSYTFRFTDAEKSKLWSILDEGLKTKQVYFYVRSEYQGEYYFSSLTSTLEIINYRPTLSPEVYDSNTDAVNRLTGDSFKLIRYVSNASWKTGAKANKGATIESQSVFNSGKTYYGASGTINGITSPEFTFAVIDSYGRSEESKYNVALAQGYWIPYIKLTCSATATEMTADGDVSITLTGKYFEGNFGVKENRMRMHYDISKDGGDFEHVDKGYIYPSVDSDGNYTYTFLISDLVYTSKYDVTVRVSDEVAVEGTEAQAVLASTPIFDWGRTDFNFNVPVTIQGGTVPTILEQGTNYSGWTYRKWSDGIYECWRTLEVTTAVSTSTNASWYSSGEKSETNLSFPITFIERPAVTVQTMPTGQSWCIVFPSNTVGSTTKTGSYQLMSMSTTSSRTHLLSYQVRGRWK